MERNQVQNFVTLNNGIKMPRLGLGINQMHGSECEKCVLEAIELGYRLFDTAQMYGNESELGNAIKKCGIPREELFITTKLYSPNTSYKKAATAIGESLKSLRTDYIDLMLIHEPYRTSGEMYRAMKEACRDGRIRAIGISNFNKEHYIEFVKHCEVVPTVNQVEAHVFYQQTELQEAMSKYGTIMSAWSPFACGKNGFFQNRTLSAIGKKYGKSAAQIGLRYLIQRGIVAIPKSSHYERLKTNIDIFDFELSEEDRLLIDTLEGGQTLFGWY